MLRCKATDTDDPTIDSRFGRVGRQLIEDIGPLTRKRMETVDEGFISAAIDFMQRKTSEEVPWFCYMNTTRSAGLATPEAGSQGKTGLGFYVDGMVELDGYMANISVTPDTPEEQCTTARRRR